MPMFRALVMLLWSAVAAPCFAGLFSDDDAHQKIAQQQAVLSDLQSRNQAMEARIASLETALKSQGLLDLLTQIEALNAEISKLRGKIEELAFAVENTQKRQKDFYVDLDSRLRRLEQAGAASPAAAPGAVPGPAGGPTPPASTTGASAQIGAAADPAAESRAYDAAYNQFKIGNYQGAIAGFQNFLKSYSASPLAPNAYYWIGNAYYNLRDYTSAIATQQKLVATYPDSPKVPDALLNIASSQQELNDPTGAKKTLEGVIAKYPASDAAAKAKRRLAALKQ